MVSKNKNVPESDGNEEQSMEEILQSIRRIIAEEEEGAVEIETEPMNAPEVIDATQPVEEEDDVLILTNEVEEPSESVKVSTESDTIDFNKLFSSDPLMDDMPTTIMADPAPTPAPAPVFEAPQQETSMTAAFDAEPNSPEADALVSEATANATVEALKAIKALSQDKHPIDRLESQVFRSGQTVEDLVIETLRPMLKDWLDSSLTAVVERIVQKEVRKLVEKVDI